VLHCVWRPEHVSSILGVMKDMPMTPEQLRMLMGKAFRACK
jgi:hypothetical protein